MTIITRAERAATGAIRKAFAEDPGEFDPRYYLKRAREAMKEVEKVRMEAFGQAGHAGDYKPISLEKMADRYKEEGHQLTTD
jgi:fructose-bisphosphate aldolase, class II